MFDFRLKVFHTVAKRLNFTKAAAELFITQPAVTKHIHEIEQHFKIKLFDRNGTKIKLTLAGEILVQHTEQIFGIYRNLEFEINALSHRHNGILRIGASTTIAQYVLPPILAEFHKKFKDITVTLAINNTEQIEQALQNKTIDFGIIEGHSKNVVFKYTEFVKDEIVLTANSQNALAKKENWTLTELTKIPILLREPGSGTLEVINHALKPSGIKISDFNIEMQLGSTESIKSYLSHSNCVAFLSIYSILKELKNQEFTVLDVKDLAIERYFYFIQPHGELGTLPEVFMKFARHYNFK